MEKGKHWILQVPGHLMQASTQATKEVCPENGSWVGIRKKREPLPIYEEALRILREGGQPPPPDPDLITWPPSQNVLNTFSYKNLVSTPPVPIIPESLCMMFASTSATYETNFPTLTRKSNPTT